MFCCSKSKTIHNEEDYENIKEKIIKISIQIKPKWRGLYYCPKCHAYWEEQFIEDRFIDRAFLKKVNEKYVKQHWGEQYLINKM